MPKTVALVAAAILLASTAAPAWSGPLDVAHDAANLGLHTAKRAVDLGLDTAQGAVDIITPKNCRPGTRYRDHEGRWHTCKRH
jgi:hypothetical protein